MPTTIEAIIPDGTTITKDMERTIWKALEAEAKEFKRHYENVMATWTTPPKVHTETGMDGDDAYGEASIDPDSDPTGRPRMAYLEFGTRVRYATMTSDFVPKTKVGWLGSRAGRGGLSYVNKKRPREGIDERKFSATIAHVRNRRFQQRIQAAINAHG